MTGDYPEALEEVIALLKRFPGVGRRSAERMALAMLKWETDQIRALGEAVRDIPERIGRGPDCGGVAAAGERCAVCADPTRDRSTICVVEESPQVFAIEKGGGYRGLYHVLGGRLSPLDGEIGENLSTGALLHRTAAGSGVREVILALGSDVEGRATAVYVADLLKANPVSISQPAQGLPAGADLSYADGATIRAAFAGRRGME